MLLIYLLIIISVVSANEEYKGYKVYSIEVKNAEQQKNLTELQSDIIDYWVKPSFNYGLHGLAMVPPSHFNWFEEQLEKIGIPRSIHIEDVYEYITEEMKKNKMHTSLNEDPQEPFNSRRYNRYDAILTYLRTLAERYTTPAARLDLIQYGVTAQNRPLVYLKLSNSETSVQKPVIVIEAGIVPRDWITIPAVLNVVEGILAEQRYLRDLDWIIMPVVNPDGYEYTHTNLRLWTKSRSTRSNLGHICPGVHINRNFDLDWQHFDSSSSPCSHLYSGTEPFSEIETQMIRNIVQEYGSRVKLYMSLQNNGGFISYPWSYERAASGMFVQHHLLGLEMVRIMKENYILDVSSRIFDRASGTSVDYARTSGILYTYNIDIVNREGSVIIPEQDIGSIVDDVWKAVEVAANEMMRL